MRTNAALAALGTALLITFAVGGVILLRTPLATGTLQPTPTPTETTPDPTASWSSFSDAAAGMHYRYSPELTPQDSRQAFVVPGSNVVGTSFSFPDSYAATSNMVAASVTFQREQTDTSTCNQSLPGESSRQNQTLAGFSWLVQRSLQAGAGQRYAYLSYSHFERNFCYRAFLALQQSVVEPKGQLPNPDTAHLETVLTQMVSTLTLQ